MTDKNYDMDVLDFDDKFDPNIKITPNYYIHMALLMAQKTLMISVMKTDIREGLTAYSILIEHIEMICKAAEYIDNTYDNKIKEYRDGEECKDINNESIKLAKISNFKLQILLKEIFRRSPTEFNLKG